MRKLTNEEFIERAIKVHGDKYSYDNVKYNGAQESVIIYCISCGEYFTQKANSHLQGRGCAKCGYKSRNLTTDMFINRAKKIHGNKYNYSQSEYIDTNTPVKIYCKKCKKYFYQKPTKHINAHHGCPSCNCFKPISKSEFLKRAINIHGDKYDYSSINYINAKTKIKIYCKTCNSYFWQTPSKHYERGQGCAVCAGKAPLNTDSFIKKCVNVHGVKYNYDKVEYGTSDDKVKILCNTCGKYFLMKATNHLHMGQGCPNCNMPKGEVKISKVLDESGVIYTSQKKFKGCISKRKLPFDFFIESANTIIEYDGKGHFEPIKYFGGESAFKERQYRDSIKNKYCKDNNIKLIRIPYWDFDNIEDILKRELSL